MNFTNFYFFLILIFKDYKILKNWIEKRLFIKFQTSFIEIFDFSKSKFFININTFENQKVVFTFHLSKQLIKILIKLDERNMTLSKNIENLKIYSKTMVKAHFLLNKNFNFFFF